MDKNSRNMIEWRPDRETGLARLGTFIPRAGRHYAANRNFDFGPEDRSNVSALSPWLRHRLILEEEVLRLTLQHHDVSAADKFIQEVFWRTYFKGWLEHHPQVWSRYRSEVGRLLHRLDARADLRARYQEAIDGRTGIDCFDAWARELVETGYLHNHSRMWFASIWIFTLRLPWQLGADFFFRHLLDGDPASNTLSWRWVGGLHTKGKTYLARADNIARYTDGRFNPVGQLAKSAPSLSEEAIGERRQLPMPSATALGHAPFLLLVTEEDCQPDTLVLPGTPTMVLGLTNTNGRSPLPAGNIAAEFSRKVVAGTTSRMGQQNGIDSDCLDETDWGTALIDWTRRHGLAHIVTAYAPVGPVAEQIAGAKPQLDAAGISISQSRRLYDSTAWPAATRGYFGLKSKIPRILDSLNL